MTSQLNTANKGFRSQYLTLKTLVLCFFIGFCPGVGFFIVSKSVGTLTRRRDTGYSSKICWMRWNKTTTGVKYHRTVAFIPQAYRNYGRIYRLLSARFRILYSIFAPLIPKHWYLLWQKYKESRPADPLPAVLSRH